ncbi:MAG TPA: ATP-binding protein, partial [Verrucomicrobiae bacterium]|nr:ATP-binding protein [Verrucomicrobiae bacterium]
AIDFEELTVVGNESLLTQCFGNLLDNAVKFVAPFVRPCIHVWAEEIQGRESGIVRIWIEDNGIGIPKGAQEKIFRMFHRRHTEAEYPGTGIGLTIVKKAVERMNGRVGLESEPGKGSKFWIDLPKAVEVTPCKFQVLMA